MSDYVANAFVRILPDTKGFESSLRAQVRTAASKVKASVLITPSTTGFQAELRGQVQSAISRVGPQAIPVVPTVVRTSEAQAALREQRLKIPIVPDFSALQAQITSRIAAINASLPPIEVPVGAVDVGQIQAATKATKDAAKATDQAGKSAIKDATAKRQAAQASADSARQKELERQASSRLAAQEKTLKPLTESRTQSSVILTRAMKEQAGTEAQLAGFNEALEASQEGLHKTEVALAQTRGATDAQLKRRLNVLREEILLDQQFIQSQIKAANATSLESQVTRLATAEESKYVKTLAVEVASLTEVSAVREANATAKAADAQITKLLDAAQKQENATLVAQLEAMQLELKTRRELIATRSAELAQGKSLAAQQALLARGAGSTGLSLLGVRGATLAASAEFLAGAAAVAAFAKAIQSTAALETELNVFAVTAKATTDELRLAGEEARRLGADITLPAVGAADAAEAFSSLAKAGLDVQNSIAGARGVLQLATAASIENAEATELVASALNAFGLAGADAIRVADLLAGASIEAQGSISDMGIALQQSAAAARQSGISLEDTVALLTLLARNGLRGSDAGTSLRTALIRLINPTTKAQKKLKELSVNIRDINGNIRPEIFNDLALALENSTKAQRDQALAIIFGQDAFRAAAILGREAVSGLDAVREATQESGLAADLAGARAQGFAGKVEALKNQLNTLGIEIGTATLPFLGAIVDTSSEVVEGILDMVDAFERLENALPGESGKEKGFFGGLRDQVLTTGGDLLKEIEAQGDLIGEAFESGGKRGAIQFGKTPLGTVNALNEELAQTVDNTSLLADEFGKIERAGGGTEQLVKFVRGLREQVVGSSEEAVRLRARLDQIVRAIAAIGRAPTLAEIQILFDTGGIPDEVVKIQGIISRDLPPIKLGASVEFDREVARREAEAAAKESADRFKILFGQTLSPEVARAIGLDFMTNVGLGAKDGADDAAKQAAAAFTQTLGTQLSIAVAEGDEGQQLAILQQQLAATRARRARLESRFADSPGKNLDAGIRKQAEEEARLLGEIERIKDDQARTAKEASDKIIKAQDEADQAFLTAIGLQEGRLRADELRAAADASLKNDIEVNAALQKFFRSAIKRASQTITDAIVRQQTIQALTKQLIQEQIEGAKLQEDLKDQLEKTLDLKIEIAEAGGNTQVLIKLLRQREKDFREALKVARETKDTQAALEAQLGIINTQQQIRDAITEGIQLDIEFANVSGNIAGEIRARQRLIAALKKQQSQVRRNSNEWKRLRNEIAAEQKAIEELRKQTSERNDKFAQLAFEFLQKQQGFAANLLGNLIPSAATSGLVGGFSVPVATPGATGTQGASPFQPLGSGPLGTRGAFPEGRPRAEIDQGLGAEAAFAKAEGAGPTRGQATVELDLLRQILRTLQEIRSGKAHPEAREGKSRGSAVMDVM